MINPLSLLKEKIYVPLYNLRHSYLNKGALKHGCRAIADFIFKFSKETALIMLVFNAISVVSSHVSQIGGLKKSDRENKDYLITQEKKELGLDLLFTIIPPFLMNNALMKKIDGGEIITNSTREKLEITVAPLIGLDQKDLYSTDHIVPVKEQVLSLTEKIVGSLSEQKKMPQGLREKLKNVREHINKSLSDPNGKIIRRSTEIIATDFDMAAKQGKIPVALKKKLYHGSAFDDIWGQRNGLLIMATLGYTIIAGNVIMPIIKNKLSNREYEKQLNKKKASEKINKYNFIKNPVKTASNNIFDEFIGSDQNESNYHFAKFGELKSNLSNNTFEKRNVFQVNKPTGNPSRMKI